MNKTLQDSHEEHTYVHTHMYEAQYKAFHWIHTYIERHAGTLVTDVIKSQPTTTAPKVITT